MVTQYPPHVVAPTTANNEMSIRVNMEYEMKEEWWGSFPHIDKAKLATINATEKSFVYQIYPPNASQVLCLGYAK